MKKTVAALLLASIAAVASAQGIDALYELRTYHAAPAKLDALLARFRDHTCSLFKKHGMTNVGYWTPVENTNNVLIYVLGYPDRAARDASWKAFMADPDWKAAHAASEKDGTLVTKVDSVFLSRTDFSPLPAPAIVGEDAHVYELRRYTTTPGHLPNLLARFRDHTCKLFEKHGMSNVIYTTPVDGTQGADNTLIYFLAHKSKDAATKSFLDFRADPDWIAAKKASEDKAGGSLTIPDGVQSTFLTPTDFSPLK